MARDKKEETKKETKVEYASGLEVKISPEHQIDVEKEIKK